ncbi:uncharacterized protein TRIADDRAFT_55884 [Trichoplax adhaerens]|uniref:Palmitoyltransferase n=1 Tax=Trichoplax adhaerens TaxID=10228 RepID=B3RW51_TRIAD|nr:hypothetical protein TRIADDRAFT_55884 [Trichoplax adhaerens]EDV25607.1 hypothetical protein TRIADDRAFT_55884 [Trichoplax adhaerens]|eukprot:XP_002111640.1 hypothetical protein TRIADDRAFT_55884 [Trichoplax adhaerens]
MNNWRTVCHWGPLIAISVILAITSSTIYCSLLWWPIHTQGGIINLTLFLSWVVATFYNFFRAIHLGPGYVPEGWRPRKKSNEKFLQYCKICLSFKVPRSHHCRRCNRCVMKMDHHCPWINGCVGHFNHKNFTLFLFFAPCGCIQSTFILIAYFIHFIRTGGVAYYINNDDYFNVFGVIFAMVTVGLSIGVILAVGMLLYIQLKSIIRNETGVENWIRDKANYRRSKDEKWLYPYHLGYWRNILEVCNGCSEPKGDGIVWTVREGCNQYTMTIEQLEQKLEKRDRTVSYVAVRKYNGSFIAWRHGIRVCCSLPINDDPRISISVGDKIMITRATKRWLYGNKVLDKSTDAEGREIRVRGWFPRHCAEREEDTMKKNE